MSLSRLHRRITAWLALLALVVGALAPTVAQAMVSVGDRAEWLEVCSVSGMVWVKADTGEISQQQPDGSGSPVAPNQHCPWCTLHGGAAGLPPVVAFHGDLPVRLTELPPASDRAPLTTASWAPAQSRAPPLAA